MTLRITTISALVVTLSLRELSCSFLPEKHFSPTVVHSRNDRPSPRGIVDMVRGGCLCDSFAIVIFYYSTPLLVITLTDGVAYLVRCFWKDSSISSWRII